MATPVAVRLKKFNVTKLRRDLAAVSDFALHLQNGPYHTGKWELLSLISPGGRLDWDVYSPNTEKTKATLALKKMPYVRQVLKGFGPGVISARLMVLHPRGRITRHRDQHAHIGAGLVRLHIPIVTHEKVKFMLGGRRQRWKAGELWYGDFSRPHSIHNGSDLSRVHLVVDVEASETIRRLFPGEFLKKAASKEKTVLKHLIHPRPPAKFKSGDWTSKPFVSRGPVSRFGELLAIPDLKSVSALLETANEHVMAFAPSDRIKKGETAFRKVLPSQCMALYRKGFTLYFTRVENWVPRLKPLIRTLERELGLLTGDVYCEAFSSARGRGMHPHFDFECNFNIQLRGRKTWKLAENKNVTHPTMSWHMSTEVPPYLASYANLPFPEEMPGDASSFEAGPGTCVFIPRGYWHCTDSIEESFSLVFVISPKTWSGVILGELERKLNLSEDWREFSVGMDKRKLRSRLRDLKKAVASIDADDLGTRAMELQSFRYRLAPRALSQIKGYVTQVDRQNASIIRWISKTRTWFTEEDAHRSLKSIPESRLRRFFSQWVHIGLLQRAAL